jgi:hypothetical protein
MRTFARLWLSAYLLAWVPLNYAAEASRTLPTIGGRGPAAAIELAVHGLVTAMAAGAGWMAWMQHPRARWASSGAVVAASATSVQSLYWSALPHAVPPGMTLPLALIAGAHGVAWVLYLRRTDAV